MNTPLLLDQAAAAPSGSVPSLVTTAPGDRSEAFRPVTGAETMQSGEKLLVEAYAAIWIILLALFFFSWRRQTRLDARIAELEGALARARREADGAKES